MAISHAGPRRMQAIRSHPFNYKISQGKRLPSKFDWGQRWSMAWDGSIQSLQRIQKAAHEVDSIDLKQIWRPNLTWKHGFDGNAHFRGLVTKCCIYNQFSVAFILHSIKAYFFTCSYFRILYSVLHLKDSSTSMRAKLDDLNSIHTLVQLNISERLHSSNKKLSFQITWRVFPPQWRNNF